MPTRLLIDVKRRDKAKKAAAEEWRRLTGHLFREERMNLDEAVDAAIDVLEEELGKRLD